MLTVFGVALAFMMLMYPLERHPAFILPFAGGCALASLYGFVSGWPAL